MPGANPVIELPGQRPKSPLMTLGPVLVTVEAPRTPKVAAVPKLIVPAYDRLLTVRKQNNSAARSIIFMVFLLFLLPPILAAHFRPQSPRHVPALAAQLPGG